MNKVGGHRWRLEYGLAESPVGLPEVRTLNHLGIVLCDVLEELAGVQEQLEQLEASERPKDRERQARGTSFVSLGKYTGDHWQTTVSAV